MIRKVGVAVLKLVISLIGGTLAGLLLWTADEYASTVILLRFDQWLVFGVGIGLFVGINWVIRRAKVRAAFAVPIMVGWTVSFSGGFVLGAFGWASPMFLFIATWAFPLGLFIGVVWALARAGAFK